MRVPSAKTIQHLQSMRSDAAQFNASMAGISQSYRMTIDQSRKLIKESRNAIEEADAIMARGWMWHG
jgi:hypothetical protein